MKISAPGCTGKLLAAALLSLFTMMACIDVAAAECRRCKKLKKAEYIGIKSNGQYASRIGELIKLGSKRKALRKGYSPFSGCVRQIPSHRAKKCKRPVFGIEATGEYLCANELRPFRAEAQALKKGYVAYQNCSTATPSATPQATPLPKVEDFEYEVGTRIADKTLDSVVRMPNDTYRGFFLQSDSKLTTIATSADGLTWGASSDVDGITIDSQTDQFVGVTSYLDANNEFVMLFELSVEISSAATTVHRVHRATSLDGQNFIQPSEFVLFGDVSAVANGFYPEAFRAESGAVRLYYRRFGELKSALSEDDGVTWTEEGVVTIRGFSSSALGADVVQLSNGQVRMYFAGTSDDSGDDYKIYSALSDDGRTFTVEAGPVVEPPAGQVHLNPEAVILPNGQVRLYITEWEGEFPNQSSQVISALTRQ